MKFSSPWITHYEKSGHVRSPRYEESVAYFKQFQTKTPYAKMFSIGVSPQGRSIECLIVAKGKEFTPEKAHKSGKAIVLIQNGIHAGEIEGKDACMLLLRDILVTKEQSALLDNLILLVIPILSVDGHEQVSKFNRPNQNGPEEMGWRTNSWNLNLNRDYMKADTPEIRSFLKLFNSWNPDFFIDNHTTNGADYQYHITYALEKNGNIDPGLGKWGSEQFLPAMIENVEQKGFLTAPYIQMKNGTLESGIINPAAAPRFSTGYTAVQNRLGLLVETHSLKPYSNRVESTLAMNLASLEFINTNYRTLKSLNRKADAASKKLRSLPVEFELEEKVNSFFFKGFRPFYEQSNITGAPVIRFTQEKEEFEVPFYGTVRETNNIELPKGYLIPKEFESLVDILELHGIAVEQFKSGKNLTVEEYTFLRSDFASRPYEGRLCVKTRCKTLRKSVTMPKGTYFISARQKTNRVIVNLLEPEAPDSFLSWGFFNAFFERKEYAEAYVMEPIAQQMLATDMELRREFSLRLEDESFRNDPDARLDFFYQRSPYFDIREKKYPILRVL